MNKLLIIVIICINIGVVSAFSKQPVYDDTAIKLALESQNNLIMVQQEIIDKLKKQIKSHREIIAENQIGIYGLYGATYETKIKL